MLVSLAACSMLPNTVPPPSRSLEVEAVYSFDHTSGSAQSRAPLPSSSDDVIVYELEFDRGAAEDHYDLDGRRLLAVAPEVDEVTVRARLKVYGKYEGGQLVFPELERLFPGAQVIDLSSATATDL